MVRDVVLGFLQTIVFALIVVALLAVTMLLANYLAAPVAGA